MSMRPLLLGHRGARAIKSIAENTLASFDRALADGCDGFEFDVRLNGDGMAVVCHDPRAGGVEIASSPAQSLPGLPLLEGILQRYRSSAFLDIELKVVGLEQPTLSLLGKLIPQRGFVVSSFLPEVLRGIHTADSTVPLGLICEAHSEMGYRHELPVGYLIPHRKLLTPDLISKVKSEGRKILVWTVNDPQEMQRFAKWGVDGIISDDSDLLAKTFRSR
jgi:glycerophosphoryl diester phosphodiesterase